MVLAGNRAKNIDEVERVETVFKDGFGYIWHSTFDFAIYVEKGKLFRQSWSVA